MNPLYGTTLAVTYRTPTGIKQSLILNEELNLSIDHEFVESLKQAFSTPSRKLIQLSKIESIQATL